jgi:hypothetical protein
MTSAQGADPLRREGGKKSSAVVARRRSSRLYRELIDGEVASGETGEWDAPSSPVKLLSVRYLPELTPSSQAARRPQQEYAQLRQAPAGQEGDADTLSKKIRIRKKYKSVSSVPDYSESRKRREKERISFHSSFAMEDAQPQEPATAPIAEAATSSSCKVGVNGGLPQMDGDAKGNDG